MSEPSSRAAATEPKRRRPRFGMRGLIGAVLVLGLLFGWAARMQRQAREREVLVAELARERIYVNTADPTYLCLVAMKVLSTDSEAAKVRCSRWIGPGWFSLPGGFNAGRLPEDRVPSVVERVGRLGAVWEVEYTRPPLTGLRLFYVDRVPYGQLGPEGETCRVTSHGSSGPDE
jgi:hypothetical protein